MNVLFEWGTPIDRHQEHWAMDEIPRRGDHIVIGGECRQVDDVFWVLTDEVSGKPLLPRHVLIRLSY